MKKHELFKIPIWEFDLDIDNDILNDYCLQFSKETPSVTKSIKVVMNDQIYYLNNYKFLNLLWI